MTVMLFANIGNSDLHIDGKRPANPRVEGEAAWLHFAERQFELTIIEPCVQEVLRNPGQIDQVVLFYTDQPATPESSRADRFGVALRDKDTIWFARIIERVLQQRFAGRIGAITLVEIARADRAQFNPSMPDEAFDVFGQLMPRWYGGTVEWAYVLMSGGLPACNSALQLHALTLYGEHCAMLYKAETKPPYKQRVGAQLQRMFRRNAALGALERQNFAAALALVEEGGAASTDVVALLRYATYREAFDFTRAGAALGDAGEKTNGEVRDLVRELRNELDALDRREMGALLRELALNAEIAFANERYADFLGRVFRFQEAALRYLVETRLNIPTDVGSDRELFFTAVEAHPALTEFLRKRQINDRPLRYEMPTIPVLGALLDWMIDGGVRTDGTPALDKKQQGVFTGLKKSLDSIEHLTKLRNQSVIAHGFAGVSREALAEACSGDASMALVAMQKVLRMLGLANNDAMARLTAVVREQLQRGGG